MDEHLGASGSCLPTQPPSPLLQAELSSDLHFKFCWEYVTQGPSASQSPNPAAQGACLPSNLTHWGCQPALLGISHLNLEQLEVHT